VRCSDESSILIGLLSSAELTMLPIHLASSAAIGLLRRMWQEPLCTSKISAALTAFEKERPTTIPIRQRDCQTRIKWVPLKSLIGICDLQTKADCVPSRHLWVLS